MFSMCPVCWGPASQPARGGKLAPLNAFGGPDWQLYFISQIGGKFHLGSSSNAISLRRSMGRAERPVPVAARRRPIRRRAARRCGAAVRTCAVETIQTCESESLVYRSGLTVDFAQCHQPSIKALLPDVPSICRVVKIQSPL